MTGTPSVDFFPTDEQRDAQAIVRRLVDAADDAEVASDAQATVRRFVDAADDADVASGTRTTAST
jgi:hypothetical protein